MSKVIYFFNKEKDAYNIWDTINKGEIYGFDFSKNLPEKITAICKGKKFEEVKSKIYEFNNNLYNSELPEKIAKSVNELWSSIENAFLYKLKEITSKDIFPGDVMGYLTSVSRCPYDPKKRTFMISLYSNPLAILQSSAHEIFHMQFHHYFFEEVEKKVGKEKAHDIKESVTVLLNLECKNILLVKDKGYESHKSLREHIEKIWLQKKDFNFLLNSCINYILKNERGLQ